MTNASSWHGPLLLGLAVLAAWMPGAARAQPAGGDAGTPAYRRHVTAHRAEQDRTFRDTETSPLGYTMARSFEGLPYYPVDPAARVTARFAPLPDSVVHLATSTGEVRPYRRYGTLAFRLYGRSLRLTLYRGPGVARAGETTDERAASYFLPFQDHTNGHTTYGGGRYLETDPFPSPLAAGDTLTLDFNMAYAPTCAYSPFYSCPLVPAENTLPLAVEAGVKKVDLPGPATMPPAARWLATRLGTAGTDVFFPAPPTDDRQTHSTAAGPLAVHTCTLRYDPYTYLVAAHIALPAGLSGPRPPAALLADMVHNNMAMTGQKVLKRSAPARTDAGAFHMHVLARDAHGLYSSTHWYLHDASLYQLTIMVPDRRMLDAHSNSPFFTRFALP